MKRKNKVLTALSIVLGISLLASGAVVLASNQEKFMFVESLQVEEFTPDSDDSFVAHVLDNGERVANIYVRAGHLRPQTLDVPVLVSIWHSIDTELDSLSLKFSVETGFTEAYLEVPGGSWPPVHFHQSPDGRSTVLEIYDLGIQGSGSATLNFLLETFPEQHSFNLEAKFSMHEKALIQLTRQEAWTFTTIPIPT